MSALPPLKFFRGDVMRTDFTKVPPRALPAALLTFALRGGGEKQPRARAAQLLKEASDGLWAAVLRAARQAEDRQKRLFIRHNGEYSAWRAGYYLACALGTLPTYPPRP